MDAVLLIKVVSSPCYICLPTCYLLWLDCIYKMISLYNIHITSKSLLICFLEGQKKKNHICIFFQGSYLEIKKQMDKLDPLAHPLLQWWVKTIRSAVCFHLLVLSTSPHCHIAMGYWDTWKKRKHLQWCVVFTLTSQDVYCE